jgi:hypothetical protein
MDEETARVHETATPVATLISRYLSRTHRDSPGQGCALPTVSAELGQLGRPSESTDRIVQDRLTLIQEGLGKDRREERSFLILSAMVGGLVLARSVSDKTLSERILQSTRDQLLTLIDEERS